MSGSVNEPIEDLDEQQEKKSTNERPFSLQLAIIWLVSFAILTILYTFFF